MIETGHKFYDKVSRLISWGHWFTFFNLILASLISLRYIKYAGFADSGFGIAYQFISLIGHFSFLSAIVFSLILFPLAFVIPNQRLYRLLACSISTFAVAFLIMDTQIFKLYHFHLNPLIWQFLQRPEQVEHIYSINLHYISLPIIFIIELLISTIIWKKGRFLHSKAIGKPIAVFLFITFIITHLTFIWADATQYRPIAHQKTLYPLSYPMTARTFLKKQGWLDDPALLHSINIQRRNSRNELHYPLTPLTYDQTHLATSPKNILLITIAGLRAEMLNKKDMPFLYKLSQQGLTYEKHFSGANNRSQGLFSLFYGLPNRYWSEITLNYIPPVLINHLVEKDYQFGLFSGIGFLYPEFLQSSFSQLDNKELQHYSTSNNNSSATKKWQKWMRKQNKKQKLFSFLHYEQSNNTRFKDNNNFSLAAQKEKLSRYQQQVLSTDKQIKTVISTLRSNAQLNNTVVIITGTHATVFEKDSHIEAAIKNAHVPLVMLWPGETPHSIKRMTSHVDIAPTLIEKMFGSTTPADQYSSGQSLFNNKPRPYLLSGDRKHYVIYQSSKITQFSNDGDIESIDWQGNLLNEDEIDITLLIDVLSKLRHFSGH